MSYILIKVWWQRLKRDCSEPAAIYLGGASFFAFVFAEFVSTAQSDWVRYPAGAFFIALLAYYAYTTYPKDYICDLSKIANKTFELEILDKIAVPISRIGIIGLEGTGKSSLIQRLLVAYERPKATDRPYVTVYRVPGNDMKFVALIDSVGGRDESIYEVARISESIIFIVDHSSKDVAAFDTERLKGHIRLAGQVAKNIDANSAQIEKRIILVANKSDLWSSDTDSKNQMMDIFSKCKSIFDHTKKGKFVNGFNYHSNLDASSIAEIANEVSNVI